MRFNLERLFGIFFFLCIVFIPLNFDGKSFQFKITKFLFHDLVRFFEQNFFENTLKNSDFTSDTIALNLLILILFFISLINELILKIVKFQSQKLILVSRKFVVYYLAFILLKYGFDKIFKTQFYFPEPNILYSQFGDLSKDILYWSTIGTSRFYSISLGVIEVSTAIFLLINRTRILGLLTAIGVFTNIILVNFGFDISVKTFSCLLLLMTLFAVFPNLKPLFDFFIYRKLTQLITTTVYSINEKPIKYGLKTFVVGLMFLKILSPYFETNNFNDDNFPRPFLHGVYQVIQTNQTESDFKIERFFIHRKNYLVLENKSQKRVDYFFELIESKNQIKLIDYKSRIQIITYYYSKKDSLLYLNFPNFKIVSKAQNWRNLRVLQQNIHYTINGIK